jgi:hypothetical protein
MRPMINLHIQVVEIVIKIALERIASVKTSDGRTQPMGAIGDQSVSMQHYLLVILLIFNVVVEKIDVPNE